MYLRSSGSQEAAATTRFGFCLYENVTTRHGEVIKTMSRQLQMSTMFPVAVSCPSTNSSYPPQMSLLTPMTALHTQAFEQSLVH